MANAVGEGAEREAPMEVQVHSRGAPVLFVPNVFEPALCDDLIAAHDADNIESGMLRDVGGKIELIPDATAKVRRDHTVGDGPLNNAIMERLAKRVLPAVEAAFAYRATRLERPKIVAYDATTGGYFRPHRDNTTPDARHRRFALTVNLNTGDYEGGCLRFPEFGADLYRPERGAACLFSCSLLHEATDVTRGRRYALLTFLFG